MPRIAVIVHVQVACRKTIRGRRRRRRRRRTRRRRRRTRRKNEKRIAAMTK
jgi:hypothetical protein